MTPRTDLKHPPRLVEKAIREGLARQKEQRQCRPTTSQHRENLHNLWSTVERNTRGTSTDVQAEVTSVAD